LNPNEKILDFPSDEDHKVDFKQKGLEVLG
jgi:hypothetical protein